MTGTNEGRTHHDPTDSADSSESLVDGRPGDDARDAGADDTTTLTTSPAAQQEDSVVDPGNS